MYVCMEVKRIVVEEVYSMKKAVVNAVLVALVISLSGGASAATSTPSVQVDEATIIAEGTHLLNTLLSGQFEANTTGELIDTSDIFLPGSSTELYNQYLYWYSGLTAATEEYWTDYHYSLDFDGIAGNVLTFSADLTYGRTCSLYQSEAYDFPYIIRVEERNGRYYISDIDTDEPNFYGFKNLVLPGGYEEIKAQNFDADAASVNSASAAAVTYSHIDELINDYVAFKADSNSISVNPEDVINMDEEHYEYLSAGGAAEMPVTMSTSYSYDRERGRRYADLYYTEDSNQAFYKAPDSLGDCTNWVSQCVWAAYGGWSDGDDYDTMLANINAKKRMQPWTSMDNWFGHQNGISNPWGNVSNFWNFCTQTQETGPQATGYHNNEQWSGAYISTDIITGQVLQVKKSTDSTYQHSVYVTGGTNDSFENIKITQHSPYNRIMLDEFVRNWGGNSAYVRQLVFKSANFDS